MNSIGGQHYVGGALILTHLPTEILNGDETGIYQEMFNGGVENAKPDLINNVLEITIDMKRFTGDKVDKMKSILSKLLMSNILKFHKKDSDIHSNFLVSTIFMNNKPFDNLVSSINKYTVTESRVFIDGDLISISILKEHRLVCKYAFKRIVEDETTIELGVQFIELIKLQIHKGGIP